MGKPTYAKLTPYDLAALEAFAAEHGRFWKRELMDVYWYNARIWRGGGPQDGYILHSLRNSHGPTWLMNFRFPKK